VLKLTERIIEWGGSSVTKCRISGCPSHPNPKAVTFMMVQNSPIAGNVIWGVLSKVTPPLGVSINQRLFYQWKAALNVL